MTNTVTVPVLDPSEPIRGRSRRPGLRRLLLGIGILVALLLASFVVPTIFRIDPEAQYLSQQLQPPSPAHLFGTDNLGRDVFVRCMYAARIDIPLALLGALIPALIGCIAGLVAGVAGRWVDTGIMRLGDILQSFPTYIFLVIIAFLVGPGVAAFLVAAAVIAWVNYARLVRSQVLVLRELDFVAAARLSGLGSRRVAMRHVLPNAMPQVIVYFASDAVLSLTFLAGLSFLGLGIADPTPEWGLMALGGKEYLGVASWITVFPGLMIVLTGIAFALVSDGIDERTRV